jgi:competence protein ComEA
MDQAKATAASESGPLATWPHCVQITVAILLALGIGFILGRGFAGDSPRRDQEQLPETKQPVRAPLDVNRAGRAELALVPSLGPSRAQSIVDYRAAHGPFAAIDELRKVPGIGPKTLEKVRPWLFVDAARRPTLRGEPVELDVRPASARPSKNGKADALTEPINVNTANVAELQKLPGIGPKLAQRIVDERILRGRFHRVDDLRRVSGIGPKTMDKIRPHVTVETSMAVAGP